MKTLILPLSVILFVAGCSNSNDDKIQALSTKLDAVLANQAAINAKLDALPTVNQLNALSLYNQTNAANYVCTNLESLIILEGSIVENSVNAETRRVGVIIYTNVMDTEFDTLNTVSQVLKTSGQ